MAESPGVYRWPTYFHEAKSSDVLYMQENGLLDLPVGAGVLLGGGERFRVVDTWFSFDDNGVFNIGLHVFLEPATEEDDRLKQIDPAYFRDFPDA
ncbi:hypothetical protein ACFUEM_32930 [Streptomyces anulatus]|uniref:hypothetical protein n=1 Tax=Streptomyces anulatus TaxID=1892 RepID=UPI0035E2C221